MGGAIASIDGRILPSDEARVSVLDRGFLYGDAVFEALRSYAGVPHALDAHVERLFRSAAIIGMQPSFTPATLRSEILAAIAACEAEQHYVRIVLTRGQGAFGLSLRGASDTLRVILVRPLAEPAERIYREGIRVESVVAPPSRFLAGAKPSSYLTNLLALEHAQSLGADDAFLIGEHGELLEGATSSVFLVRGGEVHTPTLAVGILPGITRDLLLETARKAGLVARERLLTIHDAYRADEIFVTSSVREVVAVVGIDGKLVGTGIPGPVALSLMQSYRALTRGSHASP